MGNTRASTRNNYATILNGFCAFLFDNGHTDRDLSKALTHVKDRYADAPPDDHCVGYYPAEVVKLLYEYCSSSLTIISRRNLALMALMLSTGLRISEACGLNVSSVRDMINGTAMCRRKGGAWAPLTVPDYAIAHLQGYLRMRKTEANDPLFISSHGNRLTRNAAWKSLAKVQRELEIRTGTHLLRHTGITLFADDTGSTKDAFDLSGHKDPRTTARYLHENHASLKEKMNGTTIASIFANA
jgi:site-specific recombinase XerD